jgi:hypothetical protein
MRCAPLGKQVGNFEVFDPLLLRQRYPLSQPFKIKLVTCNGAFHPYQLDGGAFATDGGIQRRRKDWR